ncbi:MAG: hypothetical protein J5586_00250 [Clostridia bacterium]|nr:hypothetical protein [Clostridia bacterium]
MRRVLAIIGVVLALGGFVLLALSILLKIHFIIPVCMILASFLILTYIKRMPDEGAAKDEPQTRPEEDGDGR